MQKPHWTRKRRMACVAGGGRVRSGGRGGQAVQGSGLWLKRPGRACDVKALSVGGGLWGAGGSEAGTLDADVSMLSPSGGRLAGPEKSRVLPERSSSSPCPSPSPRLPPQARGQWAGAGQAIPSLRAASPSVPCGSSPHAAAPAPVPLINVTICSSTETLPSFSLTSDTRLGDIPPVGCALRASSAAPRFPRGAHMGCFGFFKKAHRLPSSRFTRRGESGLGIRQSAEGFFVFFFFWARAQVLYWLGLRAFRQRVEPRVTRSSRSTAAHAVQAAPGLVFWVLDTELGSAKAPSSVEVGDVCTGWHRAWRMTKSNDCSFNDAITVALIALNGILIALRVGSREVCLQT